VVDQALAVVDQLIDQASQCIYCTATDHKGCPTIYALAADQRFGCRHLLTVVGSSQSHGGCSGSTPACVLQQL
jgi:hypothetical protein